MGNRDAGKDSSRPAAVVLPSMVVVAFDDLRAMIAEVIAEERRALSALTPTAVEGGEYLDAAGAAAILGVHQRTVTKMAARGELPSGRFGRLLRFRRADVVAFIESRFARTPPR